LLILFAPNDPSILLRNGSSKTLNQLILGMRVNLSKYKFFTEKFEIRLMDIGSIDKVEAILVREALITKILDNNDSKAKFLS
jgi:hypothetical protein